MALEQHIHKAAGRKFVPLIAAAAKRWNLPPVLLAHQIDRESGFVPATRGAAPVRPAKGLMQILPTMAPGMARKHKIPYEPLMDNTVNVNLGAAAMSDFLKTAWKYAEGPKAAYLLALIGYHAWSRGTSGVDTINAIGRGAPVDRAAKRYADSIIGDFETTESWDQVKKPGIAAIELAGLGIVPLLVIGVGAYLLLKKK